MADIKKASVKKQKTQPAVVILPAPNDNYIIKKGLHF